MKRVNVLLILSFLVGSVGVFAQIDLGVIGGLHYTNHVIEPERLFEEKARAEYGFGLLVNIPFAQCLSVQVQPMYIRKGSDLGITGFDEDVKIVGENLEVPVMLRYTFDTGKVRPYYLFGPSISYLIDAKQTASFIPADQEDAKEDSKTIEFSIVIGGGFQVVLEKVSLYAQLKYLHGLTNVDDVEDESDHSESIYSRGLSIMAGVSMPLGGQ